MIKEQINLDEHNPEWCSQPQNLEIWGDSGNLCPVPEYTGENFNSNIARKKFIYLKKLQISMLSEMSPEAEIGTRELWTLVSDRREPFFTIRH